MNHKGSTSKINLSSQEISDKYIYGIKLISNRDVREWVDMKKAIGLMEKAFTSFAKGRSFVPQRSISSFPDIFIDLFYKPVFCKDLGRICIKLLTQKNARFERDRPTILGIVLLIDAETRDILAIIDGAYLTALRTGAASGIATKYLAREDASTVAIFGCGAQGRTQLEAMCAVRPVERAFVFDKDPVASKQLKAELEAVLGIDIEIKTDTGTLKDADIICTATNAESPLFSLKELGDGVHINAIGSYKPHMQEIDPEILKNSKIFVDSKEAVLAESGDLLKPIQEKLIPQNCIHAGIGNLFTGEATGRQGVEEITVFKSVGLAVQDLYVANEVYIQSNLLSATSGLFHAS